ncbi:hypothetical protein K0M31_004078 [Melipona bicolor]|uniref:Uncharacterized protein n=1 Tax=Melipona bicolor TaxID=60889 RepID=A0AA40KP35_9HYME|nr:hypothetical protein K0M31_004078 [Melipona bicolor]
MTPGCLVGAEDEDGELERIVRSRGTDEGERRTGRTKSLSDVFRYWVDSVRYGRPLSRLSKCKIDLDLQRRKRVKRGIGGNRGGVWQSVTRELPGLPGESRPKESLTPEDTGRLGGSFLRSLVRGRSQSRAPNRKREDATLSVGVDTRHGASQSPGAVVRRLLPGSTLEDASPSETTTFRKDGSVWLTTTSPHTTFCGNRRDRNSGRRVPVCETVSAKSYAQAPSLLARYAPRGRLRLGDIAKKVFLLNRTEQFCSTKPFSTANTRRWRNRALICALVAEKEVTTVWFLVRQKQKEKKRSRKS